MRLQARLRSSNWNTGQAQTYQSLARPSLFPPLYPSAAFFSYRNKTLVCPSYNRRNIPSCYFFSRSYKFSFLYGVESYDIDLKEQKVVVKGNVQPDTVLQTVSKTGKKTAFWEAEGTS